MFFCFIGKAKYFQVFSGNSTWNIRFRSGSAPTGSGQVQVRFRFSLTWQLQLRSGSNIFKLFLHSRCKYLGFSHSSFLWKEQKNQWIKEDKEKYAMLSKFYLWQFLKVKIVLGTQPFVSITWWCLRLTEGSHISSQALLNPENNSILTKFIQMIRPKLHFHTRPKPKAKDWKILGLRLKPNVKTTHF